MRELVKPFVISGAFIAAAVFCAGAMNSWYDGRNAVLVEEVYTVRPGDTI